MKIQVSIEASTIEEYMEAIQALASGYQADPVVIEVPYPVEIKVAEEKPKRRTTTKQERVTEAQKSADKNTYAEAKDLIESTVGTSKLAEAPKEEKDVAAPEEPTNAPEQTDEPSKQSETTGVSFVDVKLRAKQVANLPDGKADIKFILEKLGASSLSKLKEDQYATFMEMAEDLESKPTDSEDIGEVAEVLSSKEEEKSDEAQPEDSGEKEVTLEMIRGKAKQLAVAGFKSDIQAVLKTYGSPSLTKIKKEDYNAFYDALGTING